MIPLSLRDIAESTQGRLEGDPSILVRSVTTDSRSVPADSLFVALPTATADGHDFVAGAREAGAIAVLADRSHDHVAPPAVLVEDTWTALHALAALVRQRVAPTSVAITGSFGKTTVKDLTAAAVGTDRRVHAASGSFNNELGVPLTVLGLELGDEVLVAEIGARHVGDIAALAPLVAPDIAVVTSVAPVHLGIFGSLEAIARAKAELVGALDDRGLAILHAADPLVAAMAGNAAQHLFVAIGDGDGGPRPDVWAEEIRLDARARPSAVAATPWGRTRLRLPIAGRHQLLNGLFALSIAGHLGVDLDAAAEAIARAPVSPWRGAVEVVGGVVLLDDAYNANPTAVVAALRTLVALECSGSTIAVLGEMAEIGPTSDAEHRMVGRRCHELGVDRVVVVGEAAAPIAHGALEAGMTRVDQVPDPDAALASLVAGLGSGDAVLVKASRVAGLDRVAVGLLAALGMDVAETAGRKNRP